MKLPPTETLIAMLEQRLRQMEIQHAQLGYDVIAAQSTQEPDAEAVVGRLHHQQQLLNRAYEALEAELKGLSE